jgi:hypothetical protein
MARWRGFLWQHGAVIVPDSLLPVVTGFERVLFAAYYTYDFNYGDSPEVCIIHATRRNGMQPKYHAIWHYRTGLLANDLF